MIFCNICGKQTEEVISHVIMNKYNIKYFSCTNCGFLQTEKPYWLKEAYFNPINTTDTGYVARNIFLSKKTLILFLLLFGKKQSFLDYAGGYGLFTRLMRDYGLDFYWSDLYTQNIFSPGFSYDKSKHEAIKALTCFECFEHFVNPLKEIENILKISKNIFFSTRLLPSSDIPGQDWEYYGFEHGQHVSFYSSKTLRYIAKRYNLNYCTNNDNLHFFSEKKVCLFFKLALFFSIFQIDIVIKKFLKSKMISDFKKLKV